MRLALVYALVLTVAHIAQAEGSEDGRALMKKSEANMMAFADEMEFEKAAVERDRLIVLKDMDLGLKPALRSLLSDSKEGDVERGNQRKKQPRKYRRKR